VRLLGLRAGWPFGYPNHSWTTEELFEFERSGLEAAEMAMRIGEPDLASGAFDQANGPWLSRGWYGRAYDLWLRRKEVIPQVTDVLEIGDFYSMGGWILYELGRYTEAVEVTDGGIPIVSGRGANVELHVRSWRLVSLHRLGEWDEALAEFGRIMALLDDRRDDPPYFVMHAFAAVAQVHQVRGEQVQSDRLGSLLLRMTDEGHSRLYAWHLRYLVLRGDLADAITLPRTTTRTVHAADAYESEAELLAARGAWEEVPEFLAEMRAYAADADTMSVLAFADRLEGRAAFAASNAAAAVPLLERAAVRFGEMGAVWERALTELDLALALAEVDRRSDAAAAAANAAQTFEALGSGRDLGRARALAGG
jgi:tetratricopeptide (TPR) repeat protein